MSLLFNMLFRVVIAFLLRSKSFFNFMAAVTICSDLEPKKIKSISVSIVSPSICHEVKRSDAMILVFWMLIFKPAFSLSSLTSLRGSLALGFSLEGFSLHQKYILYLHENPVCNCPTLVELDSLSPSSQRSWSHAHEVLSSMVVLLLLLLLLSRFSHIRLCATP